MEIMDIFFYKFSMVFQVIRAKKFFNKQILCKLFIMGTLFKKIRKWHLNSIF